MTVTRVAAAVPVAEATAPAPARSSRAALLVWLSRSGYAIVAAVGFGAVAVYTATAPDRRFFTGTDTLVRTATGAAAGLLVLVAVGLVHAGVRRRLRDMGPWLVALAALVGVWELATAKQGWLPLPYFPPPQSVLQVYFDDAPLLAKSVAYSLRLLALGAMVGAVSGFVTGVAIGWSRAVGYWVQPVLKVIGPVPATAWLPIAFVVFPSSFSASTFLVALSTWFPVTVLTWSGVAGVPSGYYDVARTLGADSGFLVRRVAVPAALPYVFVGLFMGLGSAFVTLIVAEMLGVRAGLGWYIQWAIGWAAYNKMYAALLIMAVLFSGVLSGVFALRDRLLGWQKGLLRW